MLQISSGMLQNYRCGASVCSKGLAGTGCGRLSGGREAASSLGMLQTGRVLQQKSGRVLQINEGEPFGTWLRHVFRRVLQIAGQTGAGASLSSPASLRMRWKRGSALYGR